MQAPTIGSKSGLGFRVQGLGEGVQGLDGVRV